MSSKVGWRVRHGRPDEDDEDEEPGQYDEDFSGAGDLEEPHQYVEGASGAGDLEEPDQYGEDASGVGDLAHFGVTVAREDDSALASGHMKSEPECDGEDRQAAEEPEAFEHAANVSASYRTFTRRVRPRKNGIVSLLMMCLILENKSYYCARSAGVILGRVA